MKSPASFVCFIIIRGEFKSCCWTHRRLSCQEAPWNPRLACQQDHSWTWGFINPYLTACLSHVRTEIKSFEIATLNAHSTFLITLFDLISILLYIPDNRQITSLWPQFLEGLSGTGTTNPGWSQCQNNDEDTCCDVLVFWHRVFLQVVAKYQRTCYFSPQCRVKAGYLPE